MSDRKYAIRVKISPQYADELNNSDAYFNVVQAIVTPDSPWVHADLTQLLYGNSSCFFDHGPAITLFTSMVDAVNGRKHQTALAFKHVDTRSRVELIEVPDQRAVLYFDLTSTVNRAYGMPTYSFEDSGYTPPSCLQPDWHDFRGNELDAWKHYIPSDIRFLWDSMDAAVRIAFARDAHQRSIST